MADMEKLTLDMEHLKFLLSSSGGIASLDDTLEAILALYASDLPEWTAIAKAEFVKFFFDGEVADKFHGADITHISVQFQGQIETLGLMRILVKLSVLNAISGALFKDLLQKIKYEDYRSIANEISAIGLEPGLVGTGDDAIVVLFDNKMVPQFNTRENE